MLSERQENLLKIIVEDYIKTARPVSSKSICDIMNCSSATVRSEMSQLEELGLLEKTHISSGRIPSEKGYRYYVDHIMVPKELTGDDMLRLQKIVSNKSLVVNDAIARSMEIITELTSYTAVVLGKQSSDNLIQKIEVIPIDDNNLVAIIVTDKGHVEHKNVYLEGYVSMNDIKQTVDLINKLIIGTSLDDVAEVLEFEVVLFVVVAGVKVEAVVVVDKAGVRVVALFLLIATKAQGRIILSVIYCIVAISRDIYELRSKARLEN